MSQLHVLMVDDEQISRTVACNLLRKVGYSVSAFATGAAALAALQDPQLRKKYKWLLILTDMMMPPPDGIDLLNYVRADPELFHVPVVMMSSNEHRGTVYECVKAGVDDFITKPVTLKEVALIWTHAYRRHLAAVQAGYARAESHSCEPGGSAAAPPRQESLDDDDAKDAGTCKCPTDELRKYCEREARRHTEVARVLQGWPVESVDGEQIAELLQEAGVDVTDAGPPREDTPEASALQEAMDKLALQSDRQA